MGDVRGDWGLVEEERHIYSRNRGIVQIRRYGSTLLRQKVSQPLSVGIYCLFVHTVLSRGKASKV